MYKVLRSLLFLLSAERAHYMAMNTFKLFCHIPLINIFIKALFLFEKKSLEVEAYGIKFKNPIGIAAGFDKDARYINELSCLGFGFIEVGTVTPQPQKGNVKPRLFRLEKDGALINRMGFNNAGVDVMVSRLKKITNRDIVIGGNIGKNKNTPLKNAQDDYLKCFEKLYPYVDYFVVNVSSPNTPGLRSLQDKEPLLKILSILIKARKNYHTSKPILLKIAPDLTREQLNDIVDIINNIGIEGVIATNTTINRSGLKTAPQIIERIGPGGLSGVPLMTKSNEFVKALRDNLDDNIKIIGVGGIHDEFSASVKLRNGADLIQIYTGFIFKGPFLVKRIKKHLAKI